MAVRMPRGLIIDGQGQRLWREVMAEYDLDDEPAKRRVLFDACKLVDQITALEKAAKTAPLTVKGSSGQPVINPLISEIRFSRALLAQLLGRLNFAPLED